MNSKFTSEMSFVTPDSNPAIPTYRVMDSEGVIVDKSRGPPDVKDEEVITWYKNMLSGKERASAQGPEKYAPADRKMNLHSKHHGYDYVRGTETGPSQFLYGKL